MPIKYIGRTTDYKGKPLWEILGNLKNFGVGRIIGRNRFQRYSEPSYIKILKVETLPLPSKPYDDRRCIALVEKTFRGRKYENLLQMEVSTYKADYFLVPKDEEEAFCKKEFIPKPIDIVPRTMELPPLLKKLMLRQMKASGTPITEEPRMTVQYATKAVTYRVAEEGETATIPELKIGLGKAAYPELFANIKPV